jgi:NADH dehydrogenase
MPTLQLPDYRNVFVLGDMAAMPAPGRDRAPTTAQAAYQAGPAVAHNLLALIANRPLKPFVYHHLGDMLTWARVMRWCAGLGFVLRGDGAFSRRWATGLRLPTMAHRWREIKHRLGLSSGVFINWLKS